MQIINKQYTDIKLEYDLSSIAPLSDILFIDIETTGFSAATSTLYLIGCAFYDGNMFSCKQFFAEKPEEEDVILKLFLDFVNNYKVLIHFNGNNFDIPYIQEKCEKYGYECTLTNMQGVDLYKRISPYKHFMKVPNCKQKTLEQYIGIDRIDNFSGGELINVYHKYVSRFDVESLTTLLLHNENDIQGMILLSPILAYHDMFNKPIKVLKVNMDKYVDIDGKTQTEIIMKCELPSPLPNTLIDTTEGLFFSGNCSEAIIKAPVYDGELKYFYANYKDYYFLPEEDQAMHKSVAKFVDKNHRKQATAATCYTRVNSKFLRQYSLLVSPFFKESYQSKEIYLELSDERKRDRQFFADYATHLLHVMAGTFYPFKK